MRKKIYKYEIHPTVGEKFTVNAPSSIQLLHLDKDQKTGRMCMWLEFDAEDEDKLENHEFMIVATGQEFDDSGLEYIKSYQDGPFVWHIYHVIPL